MFQAAIFLKQWQLSMVEVVCSVIFIGKCAQVVEWSLSCPHGRTILIQYLHAIARANGENKAAEIVVRYLMVAREEEQVTRDWNNK